MRITPDQLTKSLESQGIRPDTLKARLKADMVWTSLVRGRYKESLQVGEKDVAAAAQEGGEATQTEAFEYKMQPIVLIVPRGSAPAAIELRRKEAEALRERVQTCEAGQFLLQVDAECRDPRDRDQDLGRHSRPASRTARQDADRSSDRARDHQAGRGNGGAVRPQADQRSIRRRSGKSATRCSPRNTRRSRKPICRKSAKPR